MPNSLRPPAVTERDAAGPSKYGFLDVAGTWFLKSGIQTPAGGVARYYLADRKENRPVSTEITGYAVSTFTYLYSLTQDGLYLDAATRAARFLTRVAWKPEINAFPFEYPGQPSEEPLAYFFDSGIIVRGLLSLWRVNGSAELLEIARLCGLSMKQDFGAGDCEYHPILRLPDKTPLPRTAQWSRTPGCYQLKAALAWLELHKATGDEEFLQWYDDMVADAAVRTHTTFLPGAEGERVMDRLHAYCYFLEGILPRLDLGGKALGEGIRSVAAYVAQLEPEFARSDVYAQLLRAQILAERAQIASIDRLAASGLVEKLAGLQAASDEPGTNGGFYFARRGDRLQQHLNPVSTGFALQALALWRQHLAGDWQFDLSALI